MRIRHSTKAVLLCIGISGFAQVAPPPPEQPLVLRSTTRLVEVNVIVQNKDGVPATGLKPEDFTVTDEGKPVRIATFSANSNALLPAAAAAPGLNTFTNQLQEKAGTPSSITVILLDWLNTKFADQAYARQQVIHFLRQIKPEDRIGIYALGGSLTVLHDYTADSSELLRRLSARSGNLPNLQKSEPAAFTGDEAMLDTWLRGRGASGAERDFWTANRVASTCRALEFIGNHLARVPGRKNIIWVSGGFPLNIGFDNMAAWRDPSLLQTTFSADIDRAVRALNNGDVAVYPVDARGLMTDPAFSAERRGAGAGRLRTPVGVRNQQTMQELASRTGGKAYYNSNDITGAIGQAIADSTATYTLGFYPEDAKFDGKFHTLKVRVNRDGQRVRYRKGYFDMTDQPANDAARKVELRNAVYSPLDATELGVTVRVTPGAKAAPMDVTVAVAPRGITLQQEADRWNGLLDVLIVQKDDRGNQFNGTDSKMEMRLQKPGYDKIAKDGVVYRQAVARAPKATQLKVIVRDAASGSVGSVTVPFRDLKDPKATR